MEHLRLNLPYERARTVLEELIQEGTGWRDFSPQPGSGWGPAKTWRSNWLREIRQTLRTIFVSNELVADFEEQIGGQKDSWIFGLIPDNKPFPECLLEDLGFLETILNQLALAAESPSQFLADLTKADEQSPPTPQIFIVHGHDEGSRNAVARSLLQLGLEPIILQEQASRGLSIIEKLEAYSLVSFAVVLLTPDDLVASASGDNGASYRARQNVIFELGYFMAKLGRAKTAVLYKGRLELPSDIHGVIWIRYDDNNAWKFALGKELRAAKFNIDLNRLS